MVNLNERLVDLWMSWCNIKSYFIALGQQLGYQVLRCASILLRGVPLPLIILATRLRVLIGWVPRYLKLNDFVAQANYQSLIDGNKRLPYIWTHLRRKAFERAATWGCHRRINKDLADCAAKLDAVMAQQQGSPVILAPLHMFSDVLSVMVAAQVQPRSTTVIVSAGVGVYSRNDRLRVDLDIDYCSIHLDGQQIAEKMMQTMNDVCDLKRKLIIFPDITPDFTAHTNEQRSSRMPCILFGRKAYLHNGIPRLARMLGAKVIFYYLTYDKKIKIHIEEPVEAKQLKTTMPVIIETAMRNHPENWLLWHSHSLFFVNG